MVLALHVAGRGCQNEHFGYRQEGGSPTAPSGSPGSGDGFQGVQSLEPASDLVPTGEISGQSPPVVRIGGDMIPAGYLAKRVAQRPDWLRLLTSRQMVCRLGFTFVVAVACLVAAGIGAAAQEVPSIRLLPTAREAARIRVLKEALAKGPTDDVRASHDQLKAIVKDFVIRQLNAAPAISDAMLREQLQKVIGRTWADQPESGLYVSSATPWGPRSTQRLWAVAYVVWLGMHGPGGTGVVIDSYAWESGRTRLAGRQDSDYSGYSLDVDWLLAGPDKISLLAYGGMSGSNGLGHWQASVYSCDYEGVHRVWQTSDLHGLTAVGRGELITLRHARPCQNAASSACTWTYEVYTFEPGRASVPATVTLVSRQTRDF